MKDTTMSTIKILAIVKSGTTETLMRVPQVTVREDGTLWAVNNTIPLTNSSGSLGRDALKALVEARRWDAIPADNYLRLGNNVGDKECISSEELDNRRTDTRSFAEKAYEKVQVAHEKALRLQANGGVSSAIAAQQEADRLAAEWADAYPNEAAARQKFIEAEDAARLSRIRGSEGYKAVSEWRD